MTQQVRQQQQLVPQTRNAFNSGLRKRGQMEEISCGNVTEWLYGYYMSRVRWLLYMQAYGVVSFDITTPILLGVLRSWLGLA